MIIYASPLCLFSSHFIYLFFFHHHRTSLVFSNVGQKPVLTVIRNLYSLLIFSNQLDITWHRHTSVNDIKAPLPQVNVTKLKQISSSIRNLTYRQHHQYSLYHLYHRYHHPHTASASPVSLSIINLTQHQQSIPHLSSRPLPPSLPGPGAGAVGGREGGGSSTSELSPLSLPLTLPPSFRPSIHPSLPPLSSLPSLPSRPQVPEEEEGEEGGWGRHRACSHLRVEDQPRAMNATLD